MLIKPARLRAREPGTVGSAVEAFLGSADLATTSRRVYAASLIEPDSGRARLSYRRAAALFAEHTGWSLHQLRHSALWRRCVRQLEALGHTVTLSPAA